MGITTTHSVSDALLLDKYLNTSYDKVQTVANNITAVVNVNNNIDNISVINNNISDVNIVGSLFENVDLAGLDRIATNIDNINNVSSDITNVNNVGNNISNVNNVGININKVGTVSSNINKVNNVSDNVNNINTVSDNINNINSVYASLDAINSVDSNTLNINAVYNNLNSVVAVEEIFNETEDTAINNLSGVLIDIYRSTREYTFEAQAGQSSFTIEDSEIEELENYFVEVYLNGIKLVHPDDFTYSGNTVELVEPIEEEEDPTNPVVDGSPIVIVVHTNRPLANIGNRSDFELGLDSGIVGDTPEVLSAASTVNNFISVVGNRDDFIASFGSGLGEVSEEIWNASVVIDNFTSLYRTEVINAVNTVNNFISNYGPLITSTLNSANNAVIQSNNAVDTVNNFISTYTVTVDQELANSIFAEDITATGSITGATIQTTTTGARVVISPNVGIASYNEADTQTFQLNISGSGSIGSNFSWDDEGTVSVDASTITGTLNSDQIADKAITHNHIAINDYTNLLNDPGVESDSGWELNSEESNDVELSEDQFYIGGKSIKVAGGATDWSFLNTKRVEVTEGDKFKVTFRLYKEALAGAKLSVILQLESNSYSITGGINISEFFGSNISNEWYECSVFIALDSIPINTRYCRLKIKSSLPTNNFDVYFDSFKLQRATTDLIDTGDITLDKITVDQAFSDEVFSQDVLNIGYVKETVPLISNYNFNDGLDGYSLFNNDPVGLIVIETDGDDNNLVKMVSSSDIVNEDISTSPWLVLDQNFRANKSIEFEPYLRADEPTQMFIGFIGKTQSEYDSSFIIGKFVNITDLWVRYSYIIDVSDPDNLAILKDPALTLKPFVASCSTINSYVDSLRVTTNDFTGMLIERDENTSIDLAGNGYISSALNGSRVIIKSSDSSFYLIDDSERQKIRFTPDSSSFYAYEDNMHGVWSKAIGTNAYDFYAAGSGTYGSFTGAHDGLMLKSSVEGSDIASGDILEDGDTYHAPALSHTIVEALRSSQACSKKVSGVYITYSELSNIRPAALKNVSDEEYETLKTNYYHIQFNALGEGMISVCGQNGNIEIGDLIVSSDMVGKGMKQEDDIIRNYTVAKARASVTFESAEEVKLIPCIYLCG